MKNKKSIFLPLLLALLLISSLVIYAGAVVVEFRGTPGNNKVTLRWATLSEIDCKGFEIERGLSTTDFQKIGFKKGSGNSSTRIDYSFEDTNVFKSTITRTFYYRIQIVDTNDQKTVHSEMVAVSPSISGMKYTWGSIKALFR
ncbi:hypothetical protein B6I21_09550 [candidate division KSB1 bacterium 4572_119]|nr:MAG: hypothetical protein B6I21_09550 [candidate division KSB1 bacterium 4572_119]